MGNTWPALGASALRILIFAIPALWMARQPWFELSHLYTLSVGTVALQAILAWLWLSHEFRMRLAPPGTSGARAAQGG
jgi:hypothetical protein